MEKGMKNTILALAIVAAVLGVNYGLRLGGIPSLIDILPTISYFVAGAIALVGFIGIFGAISQSKLQKAGLSKVGEIAKADQSMKLRRRFRKGYLTRLRNKTNAMFDSYLAKIEAISKWNLPEGYQPKSFEDNRILTFALMDYALRLDIFITKYHTLNKKVQARISGLHNDLGEFNKVPKIDLRNEIRDLRSGSESSDIHTYGWAQFDAELLSALNRVTELMFKALRSKRNDVIRDEMRMIRDSLRGKAKLAVGSYNKFSKRVGVYGIHHEMNSLVMNMYDMYNPGAEYRHHYIVTKPGARFRRASHIYDSGSSYPADDGIEVDIFGNEAEAIKEPVPRKLLHPKEMSQFISPLKMVKYLQVEWYAMLENFRFGKFAANTRRIPDYAEAFKPESKKDVHLDDDSVTFTNSGGTAFDRRALANPGNMPFKGRKDFAISDPDQAIHDMKYPMLTIAGMREYLRLLIGARERESKAVIDEFLSKFPNDRGGWPDSEEDLNNVVRSAGRSHEAKKSNG